MNRSTNEADDGYNRQFEGGDDDGDTINDGEPLIEETKKGSKGLAKIFDAGQEKKDKDHEDMMSCIKKDDYKSKFLRSNLTDPTSALILV